jgi:murein DD-endopeptidase MepM/ murein hydrolase activator NlpD
LHRNWKRWSAVAGKVGVAVALALVPCAGTATAATGGAPPPTGSPPPPTSPVGTPASEPSAGTLTVLNAETAPRKSFFFGYRYPRVRFEIGSTQQQNDLRIDVVSSAGEVVKTFFRQDVEPEVPVTVRWDGTGATGRPARNGRYRFRIAPQTGSPLARRTARAQSGESGFTFFGYAFPVLGVHEFSLGAGRFGAPRAGHTHQGQDVLAACGTPLVAARGGRVQFAGFQAAAGNYVVIDGKGSPYDFMYAHLAEPSPLHTGDVVRTGQPIGVVGETGDATACHLHFEMWGPPGWYEGGSPFDPLPYLKKWDAYS